MSNIEDDVNMLEELAEKLREASKIKRYISLVEKMRETNKFYIMTEHELIPTAEAIENILAELDQKNKRIQELEEENRIFVLEGSKVRLEQYIKENYIPKQVVRDAINLHKYYILNQATTSNPILDRHFRDKENYVVNVLLKILKGDENNGT